MSDVLVAFEAHSGLTVKQAVRFLDIPTPTYYQYRRTGIMPASVVRTVTLMRELPQYVLESLIAEYVYDNDNTL